MAILRTRSRLIGATPPPSPIATGKGLRSAAVDDRILAEYLEKTLQVPDLVLPESQFSPKVDRSIPCEIDFESLAARDGDSISRVSASVAEFGMFRIAGHRISENELESAFAETDSVFQISEEKRSGFDGVFGPKMSNREQFFWFRSREATFEMIEREVGPDRYRKLSGAMENIFSKLEGVVVETVTKILSGDPNDEITRDRLGESVLRLCRYNQDTSTHWAFGDGDGHGEEENLGGFDPGLSLYLFDCDHDFHVRTSEKGLLSFKAQRGTIIVAMRKLCEFSEVYGFIFCVNSKDDLGFIINSEVEKLSYTYRHRFLLLLI
ncbi:hypothetical protein Syun_000098 [Stephania yunnanensis]|uniref:Non-haem dioxygenase N-terminal domain-containing protein n=1 Tax=Stephania yunnanensis TaxID=152371 RepID=A0AAP0LCJ9_9MAGN